MAQYKLFQLYTGTPAVATVQSGTIQIFSNASGILLQQDVDGTVRSLGRYETGIITTNRVVTGDATKSFSATVSGWVTFTGPSGQKWAVPAFTYV